MGKRGRQPAFNSKNEAFGKIYDLIGADLGFGHTIDGSKEGKSAYHYLSNLGLNIAKVKRGYKKFLKKEKGVDTKTLKAKKSKPKKSKRKYSTGNRPPAFDSKNEAYEEVYNTYGADMTFQTTDFTKKLNPVYNYFSRRHKMKIKNIRNGFRRYLTTEKGIDKKDIKVKKVEKVKNEKRRGKPPSFASKEEAFKLLHNKFKTKIPSGLTNSSDKEVKNLYQYFMRNYEMGTKEIISEYKEFAQKRYGIKEFKPAEDGRRGKPPAFGSKEEAMQKLHDMFGKDVPTGLASSNEMKNIVRYFKIRHKLDGFELQKAYAKRFHLKVPEKVVRSYRTSEKGWDFLNEEHAYQEMMSEYDYDFPSNLNKTPEGRNFYNYLHTVHGLEIDKMKKGFNKYIARFKAEDRKFEAERKRKEREEKKLLREERGKEKELIIGNISSAENAFNKLYEIYGKEIPSSLSEVSEAKLITNLLKTRYHLTDKRQIEEYQKYLSYRIRIESGNHYQDSPMMTRQKLTSALENSIPLMQHDDARKTAEHILKFFHVEDDRIIDNVLQPEDRDVFYIAQDAGLLKTEREETTLYDGREWRINYWILKTEIIEKLADGIYDNVKEPELDTEFEIYDQLPEEAWEH